ncbi:MAG TPA: hypothetical protein VE733_13400, partial [Streptosporangiaceae bacterium]|nr:hypothetical protein [Streptosporangiaceae bacterium]
MPQQRRQNSAWHEDNLAMRSYGGRSLRDGTARRPPSESRQGRPEDVRDRTGPRGAAGRAGVP